MVKSVLPSVVFASEKDQLTAIILVLTVHSTSQLLLKKFKPQHIPLATNNDCS